MPELSSPAVRQALHRSDCESGMLLAHPLQSVVTYLAAKSWYANREAADAPDSHARVLQHKLSKKGLLNELAVTEAQVRTWAYPYILAVQLMLFCQLHHRLLRGASCTFVDSALGQELSTMRA